MNITVSLGGLSTFRGAKLLGISLEEVRGLLRVLVGDVVEGKGGYVVGLAGLDQLVVFEEVLLLGVVAVGLFLENALGFRSVWLLWSEPAWGTMAGHQQLTRKCSRIPLENPMPDWQL